MSRCWHLPEKYSPMKVSEPMTHLECNLIDIWNKLLLWDVLVHILFKLILRIFAQFLLPLATPLLIIKNSGDILLCHFQTHYHWSWMQLVRCTLSLQVRWACPQLQQVPFSGSESKQVIQNVIHLFCWGNCLEQIWIIVHVSTSLQKCLWWFILETYIES